MLTSLELKAEYIWSFTMQYNLLRKLSYYARSDWSETCQLLYLKSFAITRRIIDKSKKGRPILINPYFLVKVLSTYNIVVLQKQ